MPTPFEQTNGAEWTSLADEGTFLSGLTATGRVQVETLGMSSSGNHPVRLATIALSTTPADAPSILWIGGQHGNEPAGREAVLALVGHLADTTDPDLVDLLGRCRIHAIPTANPDGWPTTRDIPGHGDMNRQHNNLATVEAEYVQQAITDTGALVLADCHEHSRSEYPDFMPARGFNAEGDSGMNALAQALYEACVAALTAEGIPNRPYPPSADPALFSATGSIRGRVSLLLETARIVPADTTTGWAERDRMTRFNEYQVAIEAVYDWVAANLTAIVAEREAAGQRAIQRATAGGPFNLANGTSVEIPEAYALSAPPPRHLDVRGITYVVDESTVFVPLAQEQFAEIPFLLDPKAAEPAAMAAPSGMPLPVPPDSGVIPFRGRIVGASYRDMDGRWREVTAVFVYGADGRGRPAELGS